MSGDRPLADSQTQLISWLSQHVQIHRSRGETERWSYCCVEELVLTCGYWGIPAPLPSQRRRGPERNCYANATDYSRTYHLTYVEGFALTDVDLACEHAWCVGADGQVHDPTWRDGGGVAYLGIPLSIDYLERFDEQFGNARPLLDFYLDNCRILRDGLACDAIVPVGRQAAGDE